MFCGCNRVVRDLSRLVAARLRFTALPPSSPRVVTSPLLHCRAAANVSHIKRSGPQAAVLGHSQAIRPPSVTSTSGAIRPRSSPPPPTRRTRRRIEGEEGELVPGAPASTGSYATVRKSMSSHSRVRHLCTCLRTAALMCTSSPHAPTLHALLPLAGFNHIDTGGRQGPSCSPRHQRVHRLFRPPLRARVPQPAGVL